MAKQHKLGLKSKHEMRLLHPRFKTNIAAALKVCSLDFSVHSGARSDVEQYSLYKIGRFGDTRKRVTHKDGYKNKSNHQVSLDGYGYSADLVAYVNGRLVWSWEYAYEIASAMAQVSDYLETRLIWGGNWYDEMHTYDNSVSAMKAAVEDYKARHPGSDFIDGPHFEYRGQRQILLDVRHVGVVR